MKNSPHEVFSEAIDLMVTSEKSMRERVLEAYAEHISHINVADLPLDVQYLFQSFKRCMEPRLITRDFSIPEARQMAKVVLFLAEEIKKYR